MFTLKGWLLVACGTLIGTGLPTAVAIARHPDLVFPWFLKSLLISFLGSMLLVWLLGKMAPEERRRLFLKYCCRQGYKDAGQIVLVGQLFWIVV